MLNIENVNKNHIAFMATQYDDIAHSVDGAIMHALGDEIIEDMSDDEILAKYFEMRDEYAYEEFYALDDDTLDDVLSSYSPNEVVRMALFGKFNYNDDYFTFDGYGNLESYTETELADEARNDSDFRQYLTSECSDYDMDWLEDVRTLFLKYLKEGY